MFMDAPDGQTQYDSGESQDAATLLGRGTDISGRLVEYFGGIWTVKGKSYIRNWDVQRREVRQTGAVQITSSISATVLPETHRHFARIVSTN